MNSIYTTTVQNKAELPLTSKRTNRRNGVAGAVENTVSNDRSTIRVSGQTGSPSRLTYSQSKRYGPWVQVTLKETWRSKDGGVGPQAMLAFSLLQKWCAPRLKKSILSDWRSFQFILWSQRTKKKGKQVKISPYNYHLLQCRSFFRLRIEHAIITT